MKKKQSLRAVARRLVLLALGISVLSVAKSQTGPLSLKEAIQQALKNKSNSVKARLDVENSQNKIDETKAQALPHINATTGITYNPVIQLSAVPGELAGQPGTTLLIPFGQKWSGSAAVSLSQTLFDKSVFTALKAANTTKEYYKLVAGLTDEQVIEQVATQYYQILVQQQQLTVVDSNIATTTRVQHVIEGQFKSGLAKKIDLDRSQVNLSNLEAQRQQLVNAVQLQENTLKFYMGINIETPITIPATVLDSIRPQLSIADVTPNVTSLSDYKVLQKQEELLVLQKKATSAAYYPSVSLNANYGYQGLGAKFPIFTGVPWYDYASVGVTVKIPIFNGFSTRSKVRQAEIDIKKLHEDIKNTELSLNLTYHNAKTQLNNSVITLNKQKQNVSLAEEVYANTQNNYAQGLAPLTDLLDAENSLSTAQNNYSSALLDYRLAEIQLLKAQGNLKSLLN